jgi:hypothetical protein
MDQPPETPEEEFAVLIQVGYQKGQGKRPGFLIKPYLVYQTGGEEEVTWNGEGEWLTSQADRARRMGWFMAKRMLSAGDQIRLEVYTGYAGKGEDPKLTFKRLYILEPNAPIREFGEPNVGYRRFSLLKGRLLEVEATTKQEERERELEAFVTDEEGM